MDTASLATFEFEATLDRTVLRRCTPCFERGVVTPHPLVTGHRDGKCPKCGAPSVAEVLPTISTDVDQDAARAIFGASR